MPQRQQLRWSELKVGILTVVSVILLAIAIFLVSGQTGFFTKKMVIRTLAPDAAGLKTGAPVRLAGVDVGTVRSVEISGLAEPSQAIEIRMDFNRQYQSSLRADSEAYLAAEGLLGERYINISKGTPNAAVLQPGATVPFHPTAEFSELVGGSRDLIDNLNVLTTRLNSLVGAIESGQGTIGILLTQKDLYQRLDATVRTAQTLVNEVSSGQGSIGKLIQNDEIYDHLNTTVMKLENVADQLQNGQGTIGKLMRDPSVYDKADQLLSRGTQVVDNINQGKGTLGKLAQDEQLYERLNTTINGMNTVLASLQNGEGSLGKLLRDPTLYDNLNSTSLEVRGLLADFRHDPKKFLTIHFRVF
jgi:phospholipid/cholesterol/gamma-HCH transport system substrate-binding protein